MVTGDASIGIRVRSETGRKLIRMYELLLAHFGPQNWWPAETALEVMVGAVLTQNTSWKNVEKAIANLKKRDLLSLEGLRSLELSDLANEIRPAGYFNIKARRLGNLINFIWNKFDGDLDVLFGKETHTLREELLSVKGIGPETADSILLYAANKPIFVIDAYTYRILRRHEMIEEQASYDELQDLLMTHLPEDRVLFNEFHALIVSTGKTYCRRSPQCDDCPLHTWESIHLED
jgi:endonuclease-3 related protein